jgi:hypothetical protein
MRRFLLVPCFVFLACVAHAQIKTDKRTLRKKEILSPPVLELSTRPIPFITELTSRLPSADRYVVDVKSLLSYFTSPTIPENFPMYNPSKSFKRNKKIAIKYLKRHSELLRDEVKEKLYSSNMK